MIIIRKCGMHKSKIIYNQHLIYSKGGISFMNNKKGFKTISIILALICIVFLSIFLRYRYELHSLKNEIVNNEVIKVYFDGSGYTCLLYTSDAADEL